MSNEYYESALLRLRRITTYFSLLYEDALSNSTITPVQFEVMLYIDSSSPCSITDVAQFMVVDKSTSSRVLRGIQERGLIGIDPDKEDRRRKRVFLTSVGKSLVDRHKQDWLLVEKSICAKYDTVIEYLEKT